ncbi:MAG TPA: tetratricopeptide repeat protein [Pyrinomonadaceae bacterium]|jgi:tetratricopeptide (TPR) repeat protein
MFFARRRQFLSAFFAVVLTASFSAFVFAQDESEEPDPVKIFNQGQDAHEKGDLQTAIKFYDEALKIIPEFPEAEYQRATALLSLNRADEAEKGFRRAIELRADWTLPMATLGSLLVRKNNFAEAEIFLNKAIEADELNSPAYVALAELRLKTKASESLLKDLLVKLQNLSAKAKPTASVWAARGALERALGDKAAKASVSRALLIEPANSFALSEQIEISLAEGDFTRAVSDAQKLVKSAPNSTSGKLYLARAYAESGNPAEALKILDQMDATNADVAVLKDSITSKGSTDAGALEKQLEKDPKNAALLGRLCGLTRTSNPSKSLDYCRRAAEAEPNNVNHAVGYGAALIQAKQFETAARLLRKLLDIAPDNFTARANLATALFQLKRYSEAKAQYLWLTEKKPDLAVAYYFLAISHDSLGEYMDAMANYQQFLKLADAKQNQSEIGKVNLRLPILQKQIKENGKKGKN